MARRTRRSRGIPVLLTLQKHALPGIVRNRSFTYIDTHTHICLVPANKHNIFTSATCFFHLRQIRRVRQSLDVGSAKTLMQAFVTSCVDYCNAVLAESPRVITDKLQRVMNSAARVVTDTRKYDSGLSRLMHDELHWLDVTDRVRFKHAVLMY